MDGLDELVDLAQTGEAKCLAFIDIVSKRDPTPGERAMAVELLRGMAADWRQVCQSARDHVEHNGHPSRRRAG